MSTAACPCDLSAYSAVLSRLSGVKRLRRENTCIARCPVHEDGRPSMSLWIGRDGRLMARCWGCKAEFQVIVQAIGLPPGAWFPDGNGRWKPVRKRIAATYDYWDEGGELLYQVVRFEPKDFRQRRPDGNGGWVWSLEGVRRVLYRLPKVLGADPKRMVLVVEGEKDADGLAALGFLATCNAGGSGKWPDGHSLALAGRHVCLVPDNDAPGRAHMAAVAGSLMAHGAASLRTVLLPGAKDVSDFLKAGGTADQLKLLITQAEVWKPTTRRTEHG